MNLISFKLLECVTQPVWGWNNIQTEPVLPVQHGTELTLSCAAVDFTNMGGDKATCQDGLLVPVDDPPNCVCESAFE